MTSTTDPPTLPTSFPHIPIGHPDSMMSTESVRRAIEEFKVRPTDIIVATFPKTGTTLVTWLCHQIRTGAEKNGGTDSFETLYEVVPWPLLSWDIGYDPNVAGSQFNPRVYKSHLRMASVYRGCKYVVTVRDPMSTARSFHSFMAGKGVPGVKEMGLDRFLRDTPFVRGREGRASLWEFYAEYHLLRDCPSVLILVYEDICDDMAGAVKMLATFMGMPEDKVEDEAFVNRVVHLGSREVMARYNHKFDEPYERAKKLGRVADITQMQPFAKVSASGQRRESNDLDDARATEFLDEEWQRVMAPLGYHDYSSFVDTIRQKNRTRFQSYEGGQRPRQRFSSSSGDRPLVGGPAADAYEAMKDEHFKRQSSSSGMPDRPLVGGFSAAAYEAMKAAHFQGKE